MATNHYIIESRITKTKVKVTFVGKKFKRFERLQGQYMDELISLFEELSLSEKATLTTFENELINAQAVYKIYRQTGTKKPKSYFQQYVDAWYAFYTEFVGVKPKFSKADGQNLKQIIKYLNEISKDEDQALEAWNAILSNWKHIDSFHQRNTDIKYINSQLNKIINNVKGINNKQSGVSDSYKQRVMDELRTS